MSHTPAAALAALFLFPAVAQAEGLSYSVGLFGGAGQSVYATGEDYDNALLPYFSVEGDWFSLDPTGLSVTVYDTETFAVSALLAPRYAPFDPDDIAGYEALERNIALEAGVGLSGSIGRVEYDVSARSDVSNEHDGTALSASVGTGMAIGERGSLGIKASVAWLDDALATYTYGVRASEATGAMAAYELDAVIIPTLGVEMGYALTEKAMLVGGVEASFLPSDVRDSPLVVRDRAVSAMVGIRYTF